MGAFLRQFFDPQASRRKRWTGAIALSLLLTLVLRTVDDGMARRYNREYGSILARQIASQAEGLALAASQKGISDPLGWALFYLGQGVEPRYVQVVREKGSVTDALVATRRGEIELRKALNIPGRDDSGGIRVTIAIPTTGFFGTTSDLSRDLMSLAVAAVIAMVIGFALQRRADRLQQSLLVQKQERLGELVPQLKDVLLGIGQQLRDIFRHFEGLSASSRDAHENIRHARAGFHDSIQTARRILKHADDVAGCTMHAEAAVLNLMLEAGRIAEKTGTSPYPVHLLHQQILEIRSRSGRLQREVRDLERGLEPMTTDLDMGFHSLANAQESLRAVPVEIQKTSGRMTEQARIFQKMRDELVG
jgi:hypothetical protein